jgi:glycogen operon protein
VFAKNCDQVELCLFDDVGDASPGRVVPFDREAHRTYHYWRAFVPGVSAGQLYGYRVRGPFDPHRGLLFDPEKLLIDPYARCLATPIGRSRASACAPGDNAATAFKCVVADPGYDWEGDKPPRTPFAKTIIYEMHVGAFTRNPNSGVAPSRRGTFAGIVEKIPYLRELGITAVELLPVFAFDEEAAPAGLKNVWGYQPLALFAPHPLYGSTRQPLGVLDEFRSMVKALHAAGIEVILDVVYNHTAEGGVGGPTLSLRGFANDVYYILGRDPATYADYSGCGNTLDANETVVRRMILDSLRYWTSEMHVDGFRFDLAAVLSRDEDGTPMARPPILWDIESDPVLANVKLIAEAWDAAGLYQVGGFAGESWKEWNGKFRDDVRAFVKGDNGTVGSIAARLVGSPDIYARSDREPERSINFIACHDGFTLNDLVSYNEKHNAPNGEGGRDGTDGNLSWNCGVEGPTDDPQINLLRNRQVKNFFALTLLSVGTPMLLMGDEARRTQNGNNNAYCHDNETTWFDWDLLGPHQDVFRFVKELVALRLGRTLSIERANMTLNELLASSFVEWHGVRLNAPDWGPQSHSLAATMQVGEDKWRLHLIFSAYWEPLQFELPPAVEGYGPWRRCLDTGLDAPNDICSPPSAPVVETGVYTAQPRSVVVMFSQTNGPHA